jgi:hypothetical protein
MDNKNDNSNSENGSYSDSLEIFDDIFSEGTDASVPDAKKEETPSPAPPVKASSPTPVRKVEQRPEPPKGPPAKKTAPPAQQPTKKGPSVEPSTPKEKQTGLESKDESFPDDVGIFDDIFSEGTDVSVSDAKKEGPPSPATPVKASSTPPVKKVEQRPAPPKGPSIQKAQPIKMAPSIEPTISKAKQPDSGSEGAPFADGVELFDDIFSEEIDTSVPDIEKDQPPVPATPVKAASTPPVKKVEQRPGSPKAPPTAKKPEPSAQPIKKEAPVEPDMPKKEIKASSTTTSDKRPPQTPIKKVEQRPEPAKVPPVEKVAPPAPVVKSERSFETDIYPDKRPDTDEKSGEKEIEKMKFYEKPKKNVNPFIFISSIVVLVVLSMLTGRVIDYDGIIKYVKATTHLESDKKTTVRKEDNKNGKASGVIDEESKIEDSNILQASQTLKEGTPPVTDNEPSEKVVPAQDTDKAISSEDRSKEEEKAANENADVLNRKISYPYSIYLGSYSTYEAVKKATSDYEEMGLSPYWIKLDLGEKGIWFRLFAGYFQTREEVDEFIKTKQIPGAESKKPNHVNLIGIYTSKEEVEKQKEIIEKLGYCPYVISDNKNIFRVYVGAFYQKDMAEEQNADLLLKGIQSKVVER